MQPHRGQLSPTPESIQETTNKQKRKRRRRRISKRSIDEVEEVEN